MVIYLDEENGIRLTTYWNKAVSKKIQKELKYV